MRMSAGMALMKPTSFLFEDTRTPQCHWGSQPGGRRALRGQERFSHRAVGLKPHAFARQLKISASKKIRTGSSPFEKVWRIVESEHVVIILDVVLI